MKQSLEENSFLKKLKEFHFGIQELENAFFGNENDVNAAMTFCLNFASCILN